MEASVVDLRYKMKEVLKALDRNEEVRILYHGKEKGVIVPSWTPTKKKMSDHPFFGMYKAKGGLESVEKQMEKLRGGRNNAL